ncbi:MAG: 3-phosphoserine/phosphohydroxythreonine transaminase [Actinomycetota bacterium]
MSDRVWNFSAGPATLPERVLAEAREGIHELSGSGMSILEISHRSPAFQDVIAEAEAELRALLGIPDSYAVLFLQGGASLQFSMVAMNLLRGRTPGADYVVTGSWGAKAVSEARHEGSLRIVWSGEDEGFTRVPRPNELRITDDAAYVHFTSNETIQGVQWQSEPDTPDGVPLVCDMSSDFLSRPIEIDRYGVLFAGAQKNAGPAGVTVVALRRELLDRVPDGLPSMLDYRTQEKSKSLYNTPPTFAIYVVMLVARWLRDEIGGLGEMASRNAEKAGLLYDAIDGSGGFYRGHADPSSRSRMNVTFRLPSEDLERRFLDIAAERGLLELKGHRSVGGLRASIYNAMPLEGVRTLTELLETFRAEHT